MVEEEVEDGKTTTEDRPDGEEDVADLQEEDSTGVEITHGDSQ